jgi:hypothetical protein
VLRVVDPPGLPVGPAAGKKKFAKALLAGLVGGAVISILGIVALARRERSRTAGAEAPDDAEPVEDEVQPAAPNPVAIRRRGWR